MIKDKPNETQSYNEYARYYENNPIQFVENYFGDNIKLSLYQKAIIKLVGITNKIKYITKRR